MILNRLFSLAFLYISLDSMYKGGFLKLRIYTLHQAARGSRAYSFHFLSASSNASSTLRILTDALRSLEESRIQLDLGAEAPKR